MLHPQQHIVDLSEIFLTKGVEYVVISPGSRNAPLIESFYTRFTSKCISIVDERSAAYVALGLARQSRKPIILLCTSGTAVLNYGPALAEAYYQRIPLIAITADRPSEWIDQQDNQTIRQKNIFQNFIKKSFHLPENVSTNEELSEIHKTGNEIFHTALNGSPGPVHVNIPLKEPLYLEQPEASLAIEISDIALNSLSPENFDLFIQNWNEAQKIVLILGQHNYDQELQAAIKELSTDSGLVIIAENLANLSGKNTFNNPELLFSPGILSELEVPDLLIYAGGQIVSKRLKTYFRGSEVKTWRVGEDLFPIDTFKQGNFYLKVSVKTICSELLKHVHVKESSTFKLGWNQAMEKVLAKRDSITEKLSFSDTSVIERILNNIPQNINIELGNSSIVRLSQFFANISGIEYNSNRGVSGIDGCLSSAVGGAMASNKITLSILGDLSFLYDSNALWNRELPTNLRIIILNNAGGGIFGLIPGPNKGKAFENFFIANHPVNIQKLVEAYNLNYFCARTKVEMDNLLHDFFKPGEKAAVLEVYTSLKNNKEAYQMMMT